MGDMMEVIVLFEGLHEDKGPIEDTKVSNHIEPICSSVTLIKGEKNILIDTGYVGYEELLLNALKDQEIKANDIDYVINTHKHFDHISNNHLFPDALKVQHLGIWSKNWIRSFDKVEDMNIPGVKIIETPGHTQSHCSVVVEDDGEVTVIAGDAVREDIIRSKTKKGYSLNKDYIQSMKKIFQIADKIIPGHGPVMKGERLVELKAIVKEW